jgi:hypothetical protein
MSADPIKYRQKKYFIINKDKIVLLAIFLLLFATIYFVFKGNFFRIKKIDCQINKTPCSPSLEENFNFFLEKNIFVANPNKEAAKLKENHPDWQTLQITKKIPQRIQIEIITLQPIAALSKESQDQFYLINQLNNLVSIKEDNPGFPQIIIQDLPQVDPGQKLQVSNLDQALELIEIFNSVRLNFEHLIIKNETLVVQLNNYKAIFSANDNLKTQVTSLQLIINEGRIDDSQSVIIDLRFEKPVVKEG